MTTKEEQLRILRGIESAEKFARIYSHKANVAKTWSTIFSIAILGFSSAAVLALLNSWSEHVAVWLFAVVAVLTIIDYQVDISGQATAARFVRNSSRDLINEWERIWVQREDGSSMKIVADLERRLELIISSEATFNEDYGKWFGKEAFRVIERRLKSINRPDE